MNKKSIVSLLLSLLMILGCFFSSGNMLTIEAASAYDKICTPNTSSYIYIWKKKSTDSEKIGTFAKGDGATILSSESDWLKIESGSIKGYVKKENVFSGSKLEEFAAQNNFPKQIKVTAQSLRVRQQPSTDATTLTGVSKGETFNVISETADWAEIKVGRIVGYVAKEYTTWSYQLGTADNIGSSSSDNSASSDSSSGAYGDIAVAKVSSSLNIRSEASSSAGIVGQMKKGSSATILKRGDEWTKVKFGNITGYIHNNYYVSGDAAAAYAEELGLNKIATLKTNMNVRAEASVSSSRVGGAQKGESFTIVEDNGTWVAITFNGRKAYLKKSYLTISYDFNNSASTGSDNTGSGAESTATSSGSGAQTGTVTASVLNVRAGAGTSYRSIGRLSNGTSVTITGTTGGWYVIQHDGGAGYVSGSYISFGGNNAPAEAETPAESEAPAETEAPAESEAPASSSGNGEAIVSYALQFLGNPYVYGGTSLTTGADCSGFTQAIFKQFGYSIPRTSSAQSKSGTSIALSDVQKGDLIFYGNGNNVNHVCIYIGDGKVISSSNERVGVVIYRYDYRTPINARRYWN